MSMYGASFPAGFGRLAREGADTPAGTGTGLAVGLVAIADDFIPAAAGVASLWSSVVTNSELIPTRSCRLWGDGILVRGNQRGN